MICSKDENPIYAKGLCQKCYDREYSAKRDYKKSECKNGHPFVEGSYSLSASNKRICLVCIEEKGTHCKNGHPREQNAHGSCKACARERAKGHHLKYYYGLTEDEFQARVEKQDGLCAICFNELDFTKHNGVCIDHDHSCCPGVRSCGKCIRDILCNDCNQMLGRAKDSRTVLLSAIRYLDRHN